jgi:hypothetical protein
MSEPKKRRWWQFSLRDVLWLMTAVGAFLAGWAAGWNVGWHDAAYPQYTKEELKVLTEGLTSWEDLGMETPLPDGE